MTDMQAPDHEEETTDPGQDLAAVTPDKLKLEGITVLIPTLGRPVLARSLFAIASGSAWPEQLIVLDQSRSAEIRRWLNTLSSRGMNTLYLPSDTKGRAAALNAGLDLVSTAYVAITDDDCLVHRDWLKAMFGALVVHPRHVVTGRVLAEEEGGTAIEIAAESSRVQHRPRLVFDTLSGGNMGAPMAVFDEAGGFDEDPVLRTAEDGEWAYRVLRGTYSLLYTPEPTVVHLDWRDDSARTAQYRSYALSHGGFYGKYVRRGDLFLAVRAAIHLGRSLRRWTRGVLRGDEEQARIGKAYFTGLLPGMIHGIAHGVRSPDVTSRGQVGQETS